MTSLASSEPPPAVRDEPVIAKCIPRLIDVGPAQRREALVGVLPLDWSQQDVAQFLKNNDCAAYSTYFTEAVIHLFIHLFIYFSIYFYSSIYLFGSIRFPFIQYICNACLF